MNFVIYMAQLFLMFNTYKSLSSRCIPNTYKSLASKCIPNTIRLLYDYSVKL